MHLSCLGVLNTTEDGKLTASLRWPILALELSRRKSFLTHDPPHLSVMLFRRMAE